MKLKMEHWYKFNDRGEVHIGQYIGRDEEFGCCICGKGNKAYTFNIFYAEEEWQTWGYGKEHLPEIIEDLGESDNVIIDK